MTIDFFAPLLDPTEQAGRGQKAVARAGSIASVTGGLVIQRPKICGSHLRIAVVVVGTSARMAEPDAGVDVRAHGTVT
ncbi:hypothetical protein [Streptomyces sp. NPDC003483]